MRASIHGSLRSKEIAEALRRSQTTHQCSRCIGQATCGLGSPTYVGSKSVARFCCEFLNLQHLAESAFSKLHQPNEASPN